MRISDWSSDVCSSDLLVKKARDRAELGLVIAIFRRWTEFDFLDLDLLLLFLRSVRGLVLLIKVLAVIHDLADRRFRVWRNFNQIETFFFSLGLGITRQHDPERSEEHTSELQSLMRSSYGVFFLTKKKSI